MTDRERWTVYPLLFLTLGIAVKDRIVNLSNVDTVLCNTLVVHDRKGKEQVVITSTPAGGLVRTHGTKTGINVLVGHSENLAGLMFVDATGNLSQSQHRHSNEFAGQARRPQAPVREKTGGRPAPADTARNARSRGARQSADKPAGEQR